MIISRVKLFVISSHQVHIATISNHTDLTKMAELLLSEFNGYEGDCVLEGVDIFDVMNEVENNQNNGENISGDAGKRKRPDPNISPKLAPKR